MSNPVMNYNQFMAAFKKAAAGYSAKCDYKQFDADKTAKIDQEMAAIKKGKGDSTSHIDKYTKEYLKTVKNKNVVKGK